MKENLQYFLKSKNSFVQWNTLYLIKAHSSEGCVLKPHHKIPPPCLMMDGLDYEGLFPSPDPD